MAYKNSRSAKMLMLSGAMDNNKHGEDILSPRKTRSKNKPCNPIVLRPRDKYPSYAPMDISKNDSLDKSIKNKDKDETYTPTDYEYMDDTTATDFDLYIQNNNSTRNESYLQSEDDYSNTTAGISSDLCNTTETSNNNEIRNETYKQNDHQYINASPGMDFGQNHYTENSYEPNEVNDVNSAAEISYCLYNTADTSTNKARNVLTEDDCIQATTGRSLSLISTIETSTTIENVNKSYIPTVNDYNIDTADIDSDYLNAITQQISRGSFQTSAKILADDSSTSIIQNSDIIQSTQNRDNVYIPPSESDESYNLTINNYTMLTEALPSFEQTTTTIPVEPTTMSSPSNVNCVRRSDYPNSSSSNISEYDDSDRDVTFQPSSNKSSSDSSYNEEPVDPPSEAEPQTRYRLCSSQQHLETNDDDEVAVNSTTAPKIPRIRSKDHCYFCESNVLNFARHIIRNHTLESEVQKILSYPTKSVTRKSLLTALRKKGNYIANIQKCVKPMKKGIYTDVDYLPCEKCLGFYSRKQLWKHKKKCQPSSLTSNAQADAQNFMLRNLNVDKKLKNEVFPKMRPDRVSLEAKKDTLICAYGAQYLRIHREKHFTNVTSRKMRELAKVLIELKKLKPSIKDLTDCLKPQNYDLIVTAAKTISSYDERTDRYGAPTYAMNISTSLKQCCNIAIMAALKVGHSVQTAQMEADFKTLIHIIEANWKYDVSSQACNDLNLKKWNKVTVVPLASDLKTLKEHLCKEAKTAASKLTNPDTSDVEAYISLLETIYCRVILLNRRRPGELQRLLLSTYQECKNDDNVYEEFDRAISNAEKMLMKSFKRIVIRGKRGRGVPVLFTDDVQSDINLLINIRNKYINVENNYLFAKPGCATSFCGYKVLEKYAKSCGAKNPKAITATKLRKHLATLTQMLNLKDSDIEQLANFMGHTQSVHRQNYRLPDDVYQTAKISKLLLLMEGGNADIHKGKALDEIELDLDQDLLQKTADENTDCDELEYDDAIPPVQAPEMNITDSAPKPQEVSLRDITNMATKNANKKRTLVPWTTQQKNIATKFFSKHIKSKQPPKRLECEELRSQHPDIFDNKNWLKIKVFIQNIYSKK